MHCNDRFFSLSNFNWENWNNFMINSSEMIFCSQISTNYAFVSWFLYTVWPLTIYQNFAIFHNIFRLSTKLPSRRVTHMELITEQWLNRVSRVTRQKLTSFQNSIGAQCIQFHIEFEKHASIHGNSYSNFGSNNQV